MMIFTFLSKMTVGSEKFFDVFAKNIVRFFAFLYLCIVRVVSYISSVFVSIFVLVGCRHSSSEYLSCQGAMLGTTFMVSAELSDTGAPELYLDIMEIDSLMKRSMSIFDSESLLMQINRNQTDLADSHIIYNFELAQEISRMSNGAYDVTVKPLVEAWGFARKSQSEKVNVDSLLEFVGYEKVHIEDGRIVKSDARVQLDFNSIAKGYTVDLVAQMLEERGAVNYLVDIGGEVRAKGVNRSGRAWRIGVERPVDGVFGQDVEMVISLSEGALATSGNYRRYYVDSNGSKVAHTISPKTGRSVLTRLLSATVVAENCARADALATMFMSMGDVAAKEFALAHPQMPLLLIFAGQNEGDGFECYLSPAMEKMILR